ncbi:formiminoglutamate deiminase [Mumia flava]|uniref:Formiminoglutamate deiminase n=1 Tax=Mumia flava TaxID=1348852 RepID=A0A0B2BPR4_9ACTN|nr:formimidoylglutamate deiminase [Mumia flava]PJJ56521.1 formiminoglutamate deiminase [Mumia flava]
MTRHPAFANAHSHVFHRALRARVTGGDDFWGWRERMYGVAAVLDPDLLHDLAVATYAEMRLAGIGVVGEFHYLHHGPDGRPYDDPNATGEALIAAARAAGLRICLLDACYRASGFGSAPQGVQRRFADPDVDAWAARVAELARRHRGADDVVVGAAIHSVRAVPPADLAGVAAALPEAPLHAHVSEQPAENADCVAATGRTPTALLAESGALTSRTTAVHATHLTGTDVAALGDAGSYVCLCPTTEADLADGIGPAARLRDAGARLTLGSDGQTVIDPFVEARAVEMGERLTSGRRGSFDAVALTEAATRTGYGSLGFDPALADADAFELRTDTVRTAGATEPLWAATAADVEPPQDLAYGPDEVAVLMRKAVGAVWERV